MNDIKQSPLSYSQLDILYTDPSITYRHNIPLWFNCNSYIGKLNTIEDVINEGSIYVESQSLEMYNKVLQMIEKYEIFRTRIRYVNNKWMQCVDSNAELIYNVYNIENEIPELCKISNSLAIPVLNCVIHSKSQRHVYRLDIHHLFWDGRCIKLVINEIFHRNKTMLVPLQYIEWTEFESRHVERIPFTSVESWYQLDLPYQHILSLQDLNKAQYYNCKLCTFKIRECSKQTKTTIYTFILWITFLMFHSLTSQSTILVLGALRNVFFPQFDNMMGLMVKMAFYMAKLDPSHTLIESVMSVLKMTRKVQQDPHFYYLQHPQQVQVMLDQTESLPIFTATNQTSYTCKYPVHIYVEKIKQDNSTSVYIITPINGFEEWFSPYLIESIPFWIEEFFTCSSYTVQNSLERWKQRSSLSFCYLNYRDHQREDDL